MNILFFKKIQSDKEYLLFELLKLKKTLETSFLHNRLRINRYDLKFKLRSFFLTKNISFLFSNKILDLIEVVERILEQNFSKFKKNGQNFEIEYVNFSEKKRIPPFFKKLIHFNTILEKFNANLIVQGSYADDTYISYSDLDLVIIGYLSKDIIKIKSEIEKEIIKIDPLQHHGVFFINKKSFSNYWQADLPIETLKKSIVFSDNKKVNINVSNIFDEKYSSYYFVTSFMNNYKVFPLTLDSGAFFSKYFISQLLLMPALILAFRGVFIYKRESFSLAQNLYSEKAWKTIEIASEIREQWNQKQINKKYIEYRKNINEKNVKEFNLLKNIIKIDNFNLLEFSKLYSIFLIETNKLIKE